MTNPETHTTYLEALERAWLEAFSKNTSLVLFGEDVRQDMSVTLSTLKTQYPKRVINELPLAEELFGGIAIGMSLGDLRPAYQINWSGFTPLLLDQLHRIGNWPQLSGTGQQLPITIRIAHDGYNRFGTDYELSRSLLGSLVQIPNITIYTPSDPLAAYALSLRALRSDTPTIIFEHKALYADTAIIDSYQRPDLLSHPLTGNDVTVVSYQYTGQLAKKVADIVREEKEIAADVFILDALKPISYTPIVASVKKTRRLMVVDEDTWDGGIGNDIVSYVTTHVPGIRVVRLAQANTPLPASSTYARLLRPEVNNIIEAMYSLCDSINHY